MRNHFSKLAYAASVLLAMALTFGCTTTDIEPPPEYSSSSTEIPLGSSSIVPSSAAPSSSSIALPSSSSPVSGTSGTFTDIRDGKVYRWVNIGGQYWMAENLNYNAGGSKCYSNSESNCTTYGRLYDWTTAMTACPSGWHLPSDAEWTTLTTFVGTNAGTKLKATSGWNTGSGYYKSGTDNYGFAALPGGNGSSDGSFNNVGNVGFWWSTTEYNANFVRSRYIKDNSEDVDRGDYSKSSSLLSVRCLQD